TPYDNFQPTDVIVFGEDAMLAAFAAHPPARIALVHKDTSEFGYRFFGRDYAQRLGAWIRAYYRRASLIGSPPLWDQSFGIEILEAGGGVWAKAGARACASAWRRSTGARSRRRFMSWASLAPRPC